MRNFIAIPLMLFALSSYAQIDAAEQLLINAEKLRQFEAILDNMYQGYVILDRGYNTIKDMAQGNFSIHDALINGLFAINPTIRDYRKIPYIIQYQQFLMKEYKDAYNRFKSDPHLTLQEIQYMANVYSFLVKASLGNLEELLMVITATKLSMSDEERLHVIDRIYLSMSDKLAFLHYFNNAAKIIATNRAKQQQDILTSRKLYQLQY